MTGTDQISQRRTAGGTSTRGRAAGIALAFALAFTGGAAICAQAAEEEITFEGLERVERKGLDVVFVRPGANLSAYNRIFIDPVEVAFSKQWKPSTMEVRSSDRERIRKELGELFREVFTEQLQEGGYSVVNELGPDVLRVTAGIYDLYINAPDTSRTSAYTKSYAVSAGSMTLVAELRDSESGEILARAADRENGRQSGPVQWATKSWNKSEASKAMREWANILVGALDAARS